MDPNYYYDYPRIENYNQSSYKPNFKPNYITEPKNVPGNIKQNYKHLKQPVLNLVKPWVDYGLRVERQYGIEHAITEVAAIIYLIGQGYNPNMAHLIVESWEKKEQF